MSSKTRRPRNPKQAASSGVFLVGGSELQVRVGADHPPVEEVFYADFMHFSELDGGIALHFVQMDWLKDSPAEVLNVVMDSASFASFLKTFEQSKASFLNPSAKPPITRKELSERSFTKVRTIKAVACRAGTSFPGVSMEFFSVSSYAIFETMSGKKMHAPLQPIIRVDMLAGRLSHLLEAKGV